MAKLGMGMVINSYESQLLANDKIVKIVEKDSTMPSQQEKRLLMPE